MTEPTLSGMLDLERVIGVCRHFGVPALVCIDKYYVNQENTRQIESYCLNQGIEVASEIPFDDVVTKVPIKRLPVVECGDGEVSREIDKLWQVIARALSW